MDFLVSGFTWNVFPEIRETLFENKLNSKYKKLTEHFPSNGFLYPAVCKTLCKYYVRPVKSGKLIIFKMVSFSFIDFGMKHEGEKKVFFTKNRLREFIFKSNNYYEPRSVTAGFLHAYYLFIIFFFSPRIFPFLFIYLFIFPWNFLHRTIS